MTIFLFPNQGGRSSLFSSGGVCSSVIPAPAPMCRRYDFILFQNTGNLRRPVTARTKGKYPLDYCMRELGREYGALTPEGIVVKKTDTFYWAKGHSFNCAKAIPDGMALMTESDKPHTKHQEPFNCCSEWAVWGEDGSSIEPRLMPDETIPLLRFGYPKSKEKPLRLDKNGNVLSMSLTATRRMSEETAKIFEELF